MRIRSILIASIAASLLSVSAEAFDPIDVEAKTPSIFRKAKRLGTHIVANGYNLHKMDGDSNTDFAVYRSGVPMRKDFKRICDIGVDEVAVMSGNAQFFEARYREKHCPEMEIVYNEEQDERVPVTAAFLKRFDRWIARAKSEGKKVLFRCNCGCHRTGRLAAYYRMKYNGYSPEKAIAEMNSLGFNMNSDRYQSLPFQVRAMRDYIDDKKCSEEEQYCVRR